MARLFARLAGGAGAHAGDRRAHRLRLGELELRISRRAGAARQDGHAAPARPGLGGAPGAIRNGVPEKVAKLARRSELALIEELDFPNYFLTVHDIVRWAREQGILCQGRGSAANWVVCFCLGVTAVDPDQATTICCSRASSREERDEPPDIDVDFEHERREEVMQYVYRRYGRDRAAICATVIHYRPRSAIREVGKALGLTEDVTAAWPTRCGAAGATACRTSTSARPGWIPTNPEIRRASNLAAELLGFPRHLSQHVGGFVLTKRRLDETVPIGNAAMEDRTFIEWDKDDIDALGLMKVDVLALGMLTCDQRGFDMLTCRRHRHDIADIPRRTRPSTRCCARPIPSACSRWRAGRRCPCCRACGRAILRPGDRGGDRAARPDPGRHGASLSAPPRRHRAGRLPAPSPEHGPADELREVLGRRWACRCFRNRR